MNYYPFHIGDYLSATRHLSWEEDAAFRRLLDTYYTTEKPLPLEMRQVWRLVLASTESQREAVEIVLREFFEETPEGWKNARADVEIDAMREKQKKQRERANKRWHVPNAEHANATAMPRHIEVDATASKNDANAMPPTPTPTPTPTPVLKKDKAQAPIAFGDLLPGVDTQVLADWVALRKTKKAPITQTAIEGLIAEAAKAGISTEDAMRTSCANGWQGFKAEWVAKQQPAKQATPGRHSGFQQLDYSEGVNADGTLA